MYMYIYVSSSHSRGGKITFYPDPMSGEQEYIAKIYTCIAELYICCRLICSLPIACDRNLYSVRKADACVDSDSAIYHRLIGQFYSIFRVNVILTCNN